MDARIARDDSSQPSCVNYNAILNVEDISGSGTITEPVSLQELKDYLRLEGFADDGSGISPQTPITLTLTVGSFSVVSAALIGKSILSLSREGTEYYQDTVVGDLKFTFDSTTGTITFANAANPNPETVGVLYGDAGVSSGNIFSFDDSLITSLGIEGRMWCEYYLGGKELMVGLIPRILQVDAINGTGFMPIPGPVTSSISIVDKNGNSVSGVEYIGTLFPKINTNTELRVALTYQAGYGIDCPEWAKNAIKAYVAWAYENRGDQVPDRMTAYTTFSPERASAICRPYRRVKSWA